MKDILQRLKSPVVVIQLVTILGAIVVLLMPDTDPVVDKIVGAIAVIVNVFAGLNDPTNQSGF